MADGGIYITFPAQDVLNLRRVIERDRKELGRSVHESIRRSAFTVGRSVAASTRVSPKKRKIYRATPELLGHDTKGISKVELDLIKAGYADTPFGVYVYSRGKPKFVLLSQMPRRRYITFNSKTTGRLLMQDLSSGITHSPEWFTRTSRQFMARFSELIRIGHSGLCKKLWHLTTERLHGDWVEGKKLASVTWFAGGWAVRMGNNLEYAGDAFYTSGDRTINTAMARAVKSLEKKIEERLEKTVKDATK